MRVTYVGDHGAERPIPLTRALVPAAGGEVPYLIFDQVVLDAVELVRVYADIRTHQDVVMAALVADAIHNVFESTEAPVPPVYLHAPMIPGSWSFSAWGMSDVAKITSDLLDKAGFARIHLWDAPERLVAFLHCAVDTPASLWAADVVKKARMNFRPPQVVVPAMLGREPELRASAFAKAAGLPVAHGAIAGQGGAQRTFFAGPGEEITGKNVLVTVPFVDLQDDLAAFAAWLRQEAGAKNVDLHATHAVLSDGVEKLRGPFGKIYAADCWAEGAHGDFVVPVELPPRAPAS